MTNYRISYQYQDAPALLPVPVTRTRFNNFPGHLEPPGYNINYRVNAYGAMQTELSCNRCHHLWQPGHWCSSADQPTEKP